MALKSMGGMCQAWIRCTEAPGLVASGQRSKKIQRGAEKVRRRGFCGGRNISGRYKLKRKEKTGMENEIASESTLR